MTVEIGSLVVNGNFGAETEGQLTLSQLREEVARMRIRLREEVEDLIVEAERRSKDR